ncbi:MAG: DNA alkylation repair protein [Candidatus Omnitrophica bacterium]|nr:DNA alkylation repair protein [Candidatus Omnitrophota bacterium]
MPRSKAKNSNLPEPGLKEVCDRIRSLGDPKDAEFLQRFFKTGPGEYAEGDRFLGVRVPVTRKLAKEFKDLSISGCAELLKSEWHEERLLALLILIHHFRDGDEKQKARVYRLYLQNTRYINNWDLIDVTAENIVGAFLFDKDRSPLYELARSPNLWKKRIGILSTFHFIRRDQFEDTLRISEILLRDDHDLIHKAVGWLLREVGKRDQSLEEAFLHEHYTKMPRTMLRYAIERFPEELRLSYLNGEI